MKNHYIRKLLFHFVEEPTLVEVATKWRKEQSGNPETATDAQFLAPHEIDDPEMSIFEQADHNVTEFLHDLLHVLSVETLRKKCIELDLLADELELADCNNVPIVISQADLKFWGKKFKWTPIETVLLSLGYSPKSDLEYRLDRLFEYTAYCKSWYPILEEIEDRLELLNAANAFHASATPLELIRWMERLEFIIPENLTRVVNYFQGYDEARDNADANLLVKKTDISQTLSEIEKTTLMKLIAAMSLRGYSFDPKASRNQATADIQGDLDFLGISLDQKTILKWVRAACEVVDPENLP